MNIRELEIDLIKKLVILSYIAAIVLEKLY